MTRWLPVVGWEGFYDVSDDGQVRSLARPSPTKNGSTRTLSAKVLRQFDTGSAMTVSLIRPGHRKVNKRVHVLMMTAFVGPTPEGQEVCHRDGNYRRNVLPNLRHDTHGNNMRDMLAHGTHFQASKTSCPRGHTYDFYANGYRYCKQCNRDRYHGRITAD